MSHDPSSIVDCSFCGAEIVGVDAAIDAGWIPSFYFDRTGTAESGTPACPECVATHLDFEPEGDYAEYVVKPGHACFLRPESMGVPADVIAILPAPTRKP